MKKLVCVSFSFSGRITHLYNLDLGVLYIMKKSPLYYVVIVIMAIAFLLEIFPQIIGWDTTDKWVGAIPFSQFCIYLFPLIIVLGMGALYLMDYQYEKQRAVAAKAKSKGGDA